MSNKANHWKRTLIKGVEAASCAWPKTGSVDTWGSGLSGCAGRAKSQMIKRKKSTKIYKKEVNTLCTYCSMYQMGV